MVTIDVLHLIDRLEALVSSAARVPLTSRAIVDEQEFLDVVDQLRIAVPEEIRQAKRVSQDRDRVLQQAQGEAEKILTEAQQQAMLLLQEDETVRLAQERAIAIVDDAEARAEEIRRGADTYAFEVLDSLEEELLKLLATIRKGKATLHRASREQVMDGVGADTAEHSRPY